MILVAATEAPHNVLLSYPTSLLIANLVIAVVLPTLVALVTSRVAQASLKSLILLLLSAISGVVSQVVAQNGDFHWRTALISFAQVFLAGVVAHFGLLKPTGITGSQGLIQTSVTGGLGSGGQGGPVHAGEPK